MTRSNNHINTLFFIKLHKRTLDTTLEVYFVILHYTNATKQLLPKQCLEEKESDLCNLKEGICDTPLIANITQMKYTHDLLNLVCPIVMNLWLHCKSTQFEQVLSQPRQLRCTSSSLYKVQYISTSSMLGNIWCLEGLCLKRQGQDSRIKSLLTEMVCA